MSITIEQTVYEVLPMGTYSAVISEIEPETGQFGEQLKFVFQLTDDEHAGNTIWGWCSAKFSPKSKLYKWTRAALGNREIPRDYHFNSDNVIGQSVNLQITLEAREDGTEFNRVHDLRPIKQNDISNKMPF